MADPTKGMAENMGQGRGIIERSDKGGPEESKENFKAVGVDASDRDHPIFKGEPVRPQGRPRKQESNFTQVGPDAEQENGG